MMLDYYITQDIIYKEIPKEKLDNNKSLSTKSSESYYIYKLPLKILFIKKFQNNKPDKLTNILLFINLAFAFNDNAIQCENCPSYYFMQTSWYPKLC